jgi:hypothetical protein
MTTEPSSSHSFSKGEGTAAPNTRDQQRDQPERAKRTDDGTSLTDEVDKSDIYGGRADVVGREDEVEGADDQAAG